MCLAHNLNRFFFCVMDHCAGIIVEWMITFKMILIEEGLKLFVNEAFFFVLPVAMRLSILGVHGVQLASLELSADAMIRDLREVVENHLELGPDVHLSFVLHSEVFPESTSGNSVKNPCSGTDQVLPVDKMHNFDRLTCFGIKDGDVLTLIKRVAPRILTASWDRKVFITCPISGLDLHILEHTKPVLHAVFSPDGLWVLTTSQGGTMCIWNAITGSSVRSFALHPKYKWWQCLSASFSSSGDEIAVCVRNVAKNCKMRTGHDIFTLRGHADVVETAMFSTNDKWIVTASVDETAMMWCGRTGRCVRTFCGHQASVWTAAFSSSGALVVTCSSDATAKCWSTKSRIWHTRRGLCLKTLCGHTASLRSAVFSLDETFILTSSLDSITKLCDVKSGQCITSFSCHAGGVTCAIFSFDGTSVISGGCDGTCRVCDILSGRCLLTLCTTQSSVITLSQVASPFRTC